MDMKAYAATFARPGTCEDEARSLYARNHDQGWALLRECVNRGFSSIKRMGDGFWTEELQQRKDAAMLLTKIIASRGGDIGGDLQVLHRRRIPLFTLEMAMEQPKTYTGRMVVARLRIEGTKSEAQATLMVAEMAIGSVTKEVSGSKWRVSADYNSSSSGQGSSSRTYESVADQHSNAVAETGRTGLLRLSKPDPFMAPGREFIVLARFDGVKVSGATEDSEETKLGLLTALAYFDPAAFVVE